MTGSEAGPRRATARGPLALGDLVLNRRGGVPMRDQLTAQLELKILAGALKPGQRLPSVRALARRLKLHANTVSAAYQDLEAAGHVTLKRGSGVYVRRGGPSAPEEASDLDEMIRLALRMALHKGFTVAQVRAAVERWLEAAPPERIVVVDPEPELAELLVHELRGVLGVPLASCNLEELAREPGQLSGALALALPYHVETIRRLAPAATVKTVKVRVPDEYRHAVLSLPVGAIVLLVSHAPTALKLVTVLLRSLRGDDVLVEARSLRATREWRRLAAAADLVFADALSLAALRQVRPKRLHEVRAVPAEMIERLRAAFGPPSAGGVAGEGPGPPR